MERTLAIIKPDAVRAGKAEEMIRQIKDAGFTILQQTQTQLNVEKVSLFYAEHKGKPFFENLQSFMTSGQIYALVLQKEGAIAAWREMMGPTNTETAKESAPKSLRAQFGTDGTQNACHGSDSAESAAREIAFFFPDVGLSLNLSGPEVRAYLEAQVVPTLTQALTEMCLKTPADPFTWLAQWLLEHHPEGPKTASISQMLVSKLHPGDYFGEIALLTNKGRQATVRAVGSVTLLSLDRDSFTRLCGPLIGILKRNIDQYNMFGLPVAEQAQAAGNKVTMEEEEKEPEEEPEEEEPEEEPEAPEAEPTPPPQAQRGRARRANVFVESLAADADWNAPVFEKTPEQRAVIAGYIRTNIMFNHLDEEASNTVINAMENRKFDDGASIITQGDQGDYWYLLAVGKAEVWVKKGDAEPLKVLDYGPGNTFGELALLHGDRRAATVKAVGAVECWALGQECFRRILMNSAQEEQTKREKFLENVQILSTLTKYERFRMAEAMTTELHADGAIIVREHEPGETFYIIEKGSVECIKTVMSI
mmetsp:Transcript_11675/g.26696  ORF Transcript_11675/g.26696 Transcript_11675/m.26696 type:complete len:535 (-) Transcript_11675:122-1726(-)|eukprot:CAMPEP_0114554028 /NCGR_PEP_ID=MMETSP0114-20121206/7987_1 /TAXON_ID=31324 /ORGANISM="Goniomonas sp, Strain m" /LENGTH=534 /DNA_ID=CAMNT_0001739039 /DNA_START=61 /DNA_END=1665 /DNA_ORIENTATION=+